MMESSVNTPSQEMTEATAQIPEAEEEHPEKQLKEQLTASSTKELDSQSKPTAFYATQRLTEGRKAILDSAEMLVIERAYIEKFRNGNRVRARDCFEDLKLLRQKIVNTLSDVNLALMETEQTTFANTALQIKNGLQGFDLMSKAYRPVYELLCQFARTLPESADTVNAAVIGRLMNRVRMGYYPTDPANIEHILRGIKFPENVTTNLFDPCCGCGKALRQLAQGNNCFTYGVELDEKRAEDAQTRLHRVGMGSFFFSSISKEAFHLMFLNPPYLSVLNENGGRTRHEKRFLIESLPHLMFGGLLVYVIPYYRLTPDICRILSDNFENLSVWRFTDSEFRKFKQVAILGVRKKRSECQEAIEMLERYSEFPDTIPSIEKIVPERYALPGSPLKVERFMGQRFNKAELERQLKNSDSFRKLLARSELDSADKRPLLPLSIGQIGLVGGSGMINGLVECDTPHIIKGRIVKVKRTDEEDLYNNNGDYTGKQIKETISNKMVFNVLTPNGFRSLV